MPRKKSTKSKTNKSNRKKQSLFRRLVPKTKKQTMVMFVLLFAVVGTLLFARSFAARSATAYVGQLGGSSPNSNSYDLTISNGTLVAWLGTSSPDLKLDIINDKGSKIKTVTTYEETDNPTSKQGLRYELQANKLSAGTYKVVVSKQNASDGDVDYYRLALWFPYKKTNPNHNPVVSVKDPYDTRKLSGVVDFNGFVSSANSISKAEFFVDGKGVGTDTTSPYGVKWDTTKFANGSHNLSIKVTDNKGQTGTSSIPVVVSNQAQSGMPSRQSIIDNAGLSNPSILKKSGSVTATQDGQVIENLDITGVISIKADNVTIRNVRVTGSSSKAIINPDSGVRGTTIEHCEVKTGGGTGAIGYLGYNTTVRYCDVTGDEADGIKVESGTKGNPSIYEYNYIHMAKGPNSAKHLDGMQGSGDSYYTIRYNVIDADISKGGNAATFNQAFYGSGCSNIYDITIENNYLRGGNFVAYLEGGKANKYNCGPDEGKWVHNYQFNNNILDKEGYRYGYLHISNCAETTITNNKFPDGSSIGTYCGVKQ